MASASLHCRGLTRYDSIFDRHRSMHHQHHQHHHHHDCRFDEESYVYRQPLQSSAGSEYCANSYIGWHQTIMRGNRSGSMIGSQCNSNWSLHLEPPPTQPTIASSATSSVTTTTGGGCDCRHSSLQHKLRDIFNVSSVMSADHRVQHQYDQNNVAEEPSPLASSDTTTDDTNRRGWYVPKKWKVMVALMLLIALMGVLMIVIIVTATRVQTHSSVLKLVRQYRGQMRIIDGALLDFDAALLDANTETYRRKAKLVEQRLNDLFRQTALQSAYEGAHVTSFGFLLNVPAIEVNFVIKTHIDFEMDGNDLLTILSNQIRDRGFIDATIDLKSLSIENRRLS